MLARKRLGCHDLRSLTALLFFVWAAAVPYFAKASNPVWGIPTDLPVRGDFDGDGKSDIAVWRPAIGEWYIIQSGTGNTVTQQWGEAGDIPVPGDYDGDGKTDIAVYRPSNGYWYIIQSSNGAIVSQQWGAPNDVPVVGDFDGDGKSDIAVWRPSVGEWYILQSSNRAVLTKQWGAANDVPVVGDFDGDGKSDIAVWRPSVGEWYIEQSSNGAVITKQWGAPNDVPVVGDFDGDGKSDIAVWRPSNGDWYIVESSTGQVVSQQWGEVGDKPVQNFFNGGTQYEMAVWRPSGGTWFILSPSPVVGNTGQTYQISVGAASPVGGTLSYNWHSTDGVVQNVNAARTTWIAPSGPGIHFVYVVVGDGKGGYAEARVAINTDSQGSATFIPPPVIYSALSPSYAGGSGAVRFYLYASPPSGAPTGTPNIMASGYTFDVYDTVLYTQLGDFSPWSYNPLTADDKGSVVFQDGVPPPSLLPTSNWQGFCNFGDGSVQIARPTDLCGPVISNTIASSSYTFVPLPYLNQAPQFPAAAGHVTLADGSPIGIRDPFFGLDITGSAALTGCTNAPCNSVPVNAYGDFAVPLDFPRTAESLVVMAENATSSPQSIGTSAGTQANGTYVSALTLIGTAPPTISSITATSTGAAPGIFQTILPNKTGAPSDHTPLADAFLAFKGADSRMSACQYYEKIGAVTSGNCDAAGNFTSAINFEDWKKGVAIDKYTTGGVQTTTATYVNVVDLNLTRVHHSISYGPNAVATYVCNHAAPTDTSQAAVDTAVANAVVNKNLVACVAMDYVKTTNYGATDHPATRFMIFGPSGQLLPSVNLDGRGEKFVPGACIACHGGDYYAGSFPSDGTGQADVGAHFLPYDAGNFAFSSAAGLTKADQQAAIYQLNQNILNTNITPATASLIAAWYSGGTTLDETYVPPDWKTYAANNPTRNATSVYQNVIARSCRTCHAALPAYNWDRTPTATAVIGGPGGIASFAAPSVVCGANALFSLLNNSMPNSLVTFNRFWNSVGTATDQPALLAQMAGISTCVLH
jgi:hypothetical protein